MGISPYRPIGIVLALSLGACSLLNGNSAALQTAIDKFQADITGFDSGVAGVVAKVNAGIAVAGKDLRMVCGAVSVLNGAFVAFAPLAGATAADSADEALAMASANALCSVPAPSDIATAVAAGLTAYKSIKGAVATVAPSAIAKSP